ncbi:MAG: Gfo/Idh/MocA family oxidoreductase [Litorilinea sp.]
MTEQMATLLRTAIIGTGRIAGTYDDEVIDRRPPAYYTGENRHSGAYTIPPTNHAAALQSLPEYTLVAAANRSPDKLNAFGERYGVAARYADVDQLVRAEAPDVVVVCTQSPQKAEVVIAAAELGGTRGLRAIVVEKALACSMAEADAMLAACRQHGVFLAVNHPNRFSPMMRAARAMIAGDEIGPVTSVTAHAVGGMLHIGTHVFDMIRFWAGDVTEIYARMPEYATDADLPAQGMLTFANGATGFFDHTHRAQQSLEARGPKGYVTASSAMGDGWLFRYAPTQPPAARRQYPMRISAEPLAIEPHTQSLTQRLYGELYATLTQGADFVSSGEDGARALELGLACYVSHRAQTPIALPLADRDFYIPNR